jgi:NAD(P)H-hydrate epimerase
VDLVFVAVPGAIADVVRGFSLDLIVQPVGDGRTVHFIPEHIGAMREFEGRADAVVLGPGIGHDPGALEFAVRAFAAYAAAGKPVVVDADALRALGAQGAVPRNPKAVLTPHAGEFASLAGAPLPPPGEERGRAVAALAAKLGCTILAKGAVDVISDGRRMKLNDSGNAAMATGGTGDILAGVTGAFLAKGMDPFDAARASAFAVGAAGDVALNKVGHSMLATDVLAELPGVLARYVPWWTKR